MKRRAFCVSAAAAIGAAAFPFGRAFAAVSAVTADVAAVTGDGKKDPAARRRRGGLPRGVARPTAAAGCRRLRGRAQDLQRHVRSPSSADRPLPGRRGCRARRALRARARAARRRARRRPQPVGSVGVRRRAHDRPVLDARRARGSDRPARARWRRSAARRSRSRDAAIRPRHDHRHGFAYRRRRLDAGRRIRAPGAPLRPRLRSAVDRSTSLPPTDNCSKPAPPRIRTCSGPIRGGGGNFGIATSFEYRLHPFDGRAVGGHMVFPFEQARQALRGFAELFDRAPDGLWIEPILTTLPGGARAGPGRLLHGRPGIGGSRLGALSAARQAAQGRRRAGAIRAVADAGRRARAHRRPLLHQVRIRGPARRQADRRDAGDRSRGAPVPRARIAMPPKGAAVDRVARDARRSGIAEPCTA